MTSYQIIFEDDDNDDLPSCKQLIFPLTLSGNWEIPWDVASHCRSRYVIHLGTGDPIQGHWFSCNTISAVNIDPFGIPSLAGDLVFYLSRHRRLVLYTISPQSDFFVVFFSTDQQTFILHITKRSTFEIEVFFFTRSETREEMSQLLIRPVSAVIRK